MTNKWYLLAFNFFQKKEKDKQVVCALDTMTIFPPVPF